MFLDVTGRDLCPVASILSYMVLRDTTQVPSSNFPTELALLGTDLFMWCGQLWTAPDTALLFTRVIASLSVQLPPWLSSV